MLEVVIGVLVVEVNKVADGVADMEVEKVADMKIPIEVLLDWSDSGDWWIGDWVKTPSEDFYDETLLIGDYGDDVRGVDWCAGHVGWLGPG